MEFLDGWEHWLRLLDGFLQNRERHAECIECIFEVHFSACPACLHLYWENVHFFWWLLWQGAILAIELVIQCWFLPYQWWVDWSDCSATSTVIMQKPWVVEPSLTCCHYNLYIPHSGNLASDVPTLFLLSLLITVFFSLAFVTLTPSKGWSNRLVHTAMCIHITSHAIPSQHMSPPIPPWELWRSLVERHGWTFSEIFRDAFTL